MKSRPSRQKALAVPAWLLGLIIAGCASDQQQLDVDGAAGEIEAELASRFGLRSPMLQCPEEVAATRGARFACDGSDARGRGFEVEVEVLNDQGRFTYSRPRFERPG